MSFAAGAFSGGARGRGGGGGGGQSGPPKNDQKMFSKGKQDKQGDGSDPRGRGDGSGGGGPSQITASLMFHAMSSMSPSGGGSAKEGYNAKDDPQYLDNDRGYHHHHHDMAYDYDG